MGFWNNLFKFGSQNMAIDLGTANTLVYVEGQGIVHAVATNSGGPCVLITGHARARVESRESCSAAAVTKVHTTAAGEAESGAEAEVACRCRWLRRRVLFGAGQFHATAAGQFQVTIAGRGCSRQINDHVAGVFIDSSKEVDLFNFEYKFVFVTELLKLSAADHFTNLILAYSELLTGFWHGVEHLVHGEELQLAYRARKHLFQA